MKEMGQLSPERLRRKWDPALLGFETTEQLPELEGLVGQERAVAALRFGLSITSSGYNIYVAGPPGTGKSSYTIALARSHAAHQPVPSDWVYVYNFDRPDEPLALELPPGTGRAFAQGMEEVITDARAATGRALTSQSHQSRREELVRSTRTRIGEMLEALSERARREGFSLTQTDAGLVSVPVVRGKPITEEQYAHLPADTRREISHRAEQLQEAISDLRRQTWELEKQLQESLRDLDINVAKEAVAPVVGQIRAKYQNLPKVVEWLNRVERELVGCIVRNAAPVPSSDSDEEGGDMPEMLLQPGRRRRTDPFARFRVNVFVHRDQAQGAPVVVEPNPTYANLFGTAEFLNPGDGSGETGVSHIKPGAIHQANGGYLILQAADVLSSPYAWEALKRALATGEARIEVPGQERRLFPVDAVRPQPIPLHVKVFLIGSSFIYHLLYARDEGFRELFKLKAEFDTVMDANPANVQGYAGFISSVCRRRGLKHLTAGAVARVLEHSQRLAEDQEKLSARFNEVVELIYEANAWSGDRPFVDSEDIIRTIREKAARSALPEERLLEMMQRGTVLVDVDGAVVGQVNGLTVMDMGDYRFGSPSRITARVYTGEKGILHIEREIAMSGQIHDKGVYTIAGFLGDRFAQNKPLSFSASIAFEQTYVPVDGDSASSSELYALLSALSGVPIDQGIAVTGSVNQRGQVQPIGGVNEKIEGYFRVCKSLGLTGRQGVMIPTLNVSNLMLSEEVVEAVRAGQFHIWAVSTIEEGIEVLTGMPAGERRPDGSYPEGSLFDLVDRRIEEMGRRLVAWGRPVE